MGFTSPSMELPPAKLSKGLVSSADSAGAVDLKLKATQK